MTTETEWRCYADLIAAGDQTEIGRVVKQLEAAGYTVTPPDPLAADREFLAGLLEALECRPDDMRMRQGQDDDIIPAAMDYLRQNKGRL